MALPDEVPATSAIHHLVWVYLALRQLARLRPMSDAHPMVRMDGLDKCTNALGRGSRIIPVPWRHKRHRTIECVDEISRGRRQHACHFLQGAGGSALIQPQRLLAR